MFFVIVFFQAEDGIRDLVRSRGLGDVYKRQEMPSGIPTVDDLKSESSTGFPKNTVTTAITINMSCLLYTSDAADERSSVDLGGRRIIKKKKRIDNSGAGRIVVKQNPQEMPRISK